MLVLTLQGGSDDYYFYLLESTPSLDHLSSQYTSFPVHFGDSDGGYEVRVLAVRDDTYVTIPVFSINITLNRGEFHMVDNADTRLGFKISCSKPCMAVQYMRSLGYGGTDYVRMGPFLAVLTGDTRAANSFIFTAPSMIDSSSTMHGAISVITDTFPGTGLHLNDDSLQDLEWEQVEDSTNWYATMAIEGQFFQLYSTEASER